MSSKAEYFNLKEIDRYWGSKQTTIIDHQIAAELVTFTLNLRSYKQNSPNRTLRSGDEQPLEDTWRVLDIWESLRGVCDSNRFD